MSSSVDKKGGGRSSSLRPAEAVVQQLVVDTATLLRWLSYHPYDSRRSAGGYPDLTLTRERVVFAELKKEGEQPRADQVVWLDALSGAGAEVYLWRLSDFEEIKAILNRRWVFFAHGSSGDLKTPALAAPDVVWWQPRSIWVPGHGRSDA